MAYTLINRSSGTVEERGLTAEAAADVILTRDGGAYEVRREPARHDVGGEAAWQIYVRDASGRWVPCHVGEAPGRLARVYAPSEAAAWPALARMVVEGCSAWRGAPDAMADDAYDAMMAELAAEEAAG